VAADLLTLGLGPLHRWPEWRWARQAPSLLGPLLASAAGQATLAGALACVLGIHVLARARARRMWDAQAGSTSLLLVAVMWALPLSAVTLFVVLYGSRLFVPAREPGLGTPVGRFVGGHFAARLVLWAVLVGFLARFWAALLTAAKGSRLGVQLPVAPEGPRPSTAQPVWQPPGGRLSRLLRLGVALSVGGLALALLLHLTPRWEAALFELSALARGCAHAALAFFARMGHLAAQSPAYAAAAGLTWYLLVCIHEEGRRGRVQLHALLGIVWLLGLVPMTVAFIGDARATPEPAVPGRMAALAVAVAVGAALFVAALAVIASWWGWRRRLTDREEPVPGAAAWAAHSLGSIGLVVCLAGGAAVLHGALAGNAAYLRAFQRAANGADAFVSFVAAAVDGLKMDLEMRGNVQPAAAILASASAVLLLFHFAARWRLSWARSAVYALWLGAALVGVAVLTCLIYELPFGTWTAGQVLGALALGAFVLRTLGALLGPEPRAT